MYLMYHKYNLFISKCTQMAQSAANAHLEEQSSKAWCSPAKAGKEMEQEHWI